ncbi:MAG: DUF3592 domain-containing protein [Oscillospiraceae bacterium]|nr:DUF3592 domain-containing protein [Oscillospiraceae bacterium]
MNESPFIIDKDQTEAPEKKKKGTKVLAFILIAACIGSLILMIRKQDTPTSFLFFGLLFMSFGIMGTYGVKITRGNAWTLGFPIGGAVVAAMSGLYLVGGDSLRENYPRVLSSLLPVVLIVSGLMLSAGSVFMEEHRKKTCCEEIKAVVVKVKKTHRNEHSRYYLYCPVLRYTYNGAEYTVCDDLYNLDKEPIVDSALRIHIDPERPDRIYREHIRGFRFKICLGIMLIVFSVPFIMFLMQTKNQ